MPLSDKAKWLLDRAVAQVKADGGRIWGFTCTAGEKEAELEPFSSHDDPAEKFIEMTAAAAKLMHDAQPGNEAIRGENAVN